MSVQLIQSTFRGVRCRRRLARAKALPDDLWGLIVYFLRERNPASVASRRMARYVTTSVLKMRFAPAHIARHAFPKTARLVRTYAHLLPPRTIAHTRACALRILQTRFGNDKAVISANVFLEAFDCAPTA
jgi:hypothetical protein